MSFRSFGNRGWRRLLLATLVGAASLGACPRVWAEAGEGIETVQEQAGQIAQKIAPYKGKFVVFVLDVSGSMTNQGRLQASNEALATIVRNGTRVGDRVAIFSFDVSPELLLKETVIQKESDKKILIDRIPTVSSNTVGSNIRWAHHEALKLLEPSECPYQVCVLVSDNLHDPPGETDRFYPDYLNYYIPGTMEAPSTPQSNDYARLREKFRGGTRLTFGIGVNISETGAVQELPPLKKTPAWVWLAAAAAVVALAGAGWVGASAWRRAAEARQIANSPMNVVIRNVTPDGTASPFSAETHLVLQPNESFTIGGAPFGIGQVVSLPGAMMKEPVARVHRRGLSFSLEALPGQETVAVYVDGIEAVPGGDAIPIRLGQTISVRYRVMTGIEKSVDLLFADPQAVAEQPATEEVSFDESHQSPY